MPVRGGGWRDVEGPEAKLRQRGGVAGYRGLAAALREAGDVCIDDRGGELRASGGGGGGGGGWGGVLGGGVGVGGWWVVDASRLGGCGDALRWCGRLGW